MLIRLTPGGSLLVGTGGKQAVYDYLDAKQGEYAFPSSASQSHFTAMDERGDSRREQRGLYRL